MLQPFEESKNNADISHTQSIEDRTKETMALRRQPFTKEQCKKWTVETASQNLSPLLHDNFESASPVPSLNACIKHYLSTHSSLQVLRRYNFKESNGRTMPSFG
jgi:hypothetical protein